MAEDKKWTLGKIATIIGIFSFFVGSAAYLGRLAWQDQLTKAMVDEFKNPHSEFHNLVVDSMKDYMFEEFGNLVQEAMADAVKKEGLINAFQNFQNLPPEQLRPKVDSIWNIGLYCARNWHTIKANIDYTKQERTTRETYSTFKIIGNRKPEFVVGFDGLQHKIYKGKPILKEREEIFYFRDSKDEPIPLPFLYE